MKNLSQFESSESAESEKSDITVLEGKGNKYEKKLRDRTKGLNLSQDDQEVEVF